jgi:uncharacterized membrane protein YgdD (TMEM256/DUF423 family)
MKNLNFIYLFVVFVGISGCFSVLFGAWFAHAGQALPIIDKVRLENAQLYQFIHTLALLTVVVWYLRMPSRWLLWSGICFTLGILCFSGSLYIKTFFVFSSIGKLAPFGGILLAAGWLCISLIGKSHLVKILNNSVNKK